MFALLKADRAKVGSGSEGSVSEIVYEGYYYDVTHWLDSHPGGPVITYYTQHGEDATLAIQQFHHRQLPKINSILKSFKRQPVEEGNSPIVAPSGNTSRRDLELTKDFQKLFLELKAEGYFKPSIPHIVYRVSELLILHMLGLHFLNFSAWPVRLLGLIISTTFMIRCVFLMHEAGHKSLTGVSTIDKVVRSVLFAYCAGLSGSFWADQHGRHHSMPQRPERDIDLDTLPFALQSSKLVKNSNELERGKGFWIQNQTIFTPLILCLITLTWKVYLHPLYAWRHGAHLELLVMIIHYAVFLLSGLFGPIEYLVSYCVGTMYIVGFLILPHSHLPVSHSQLHWVEYSFSNTVSIKSNWLLDWLMGHLNYHVEHHLFPTMPNFRLRAVRGRVALLAEKHGLDYRSVSVVEALKATLANLSKTAEEVKQMEWMTME